MTARELLAAEAFRCRNVTEKATEASGRCAVLLAPEALMRKFIFSSAMIGVLAGGWNTMQATRNGPRDWRLVMLWLGWGLSAAVAIGNVIEDANKRRIEE